MTYGGDDDLHAKLWRDLRNRIAVALCKGQAEIIQYLNYRNGDTRHLPMDSYECPKAPRRIDRRVGVYMCVSVVYVDA